MEVEQAKDPTGTKRADTSWLATAPATLNPQPTEHVIKLHSAVTRARQWGSPLQQEG